MSLIPKLRMCRGAENMLMPVSIFSEKEKYGMSINICELKGFFLLAMDSQYLIQYFKKLKNGCHLFLKVIRDISQCVVFRDISDTTH